MTFHRGRKRGVAGLKPGNGMPNFRVSEGAMKRRLGNHGGNLERRVVGKWGVWAVPDWAIFTRPFLSGRVFSGLMSRWPMPASWAYCKASQICVTIRNVS